MSYRWGLSLTAVTALALSSVAQPARAVVINFEDMTGSTRFVDACAAVSCPQTVIENTSAGLVTINGGVVLTHATNLPADQTSIYGTANLVAGLQNPITISFQNPVQNFLVDVINGSTSARNFQLADNAGHSSTFSLASNTSSGATTIGFAATGTQITLADTSGGAAFDFFIDNITFNVPISCTNSSCQQQDGTGTVPEPSTLSLLALPALALLFRRKGKA